MLTSSNVLQIAPWAPALCFALCGCGGAEMSPKIEDKARRDVPVAICRKTLDPGELTDAGAPHDESYWSVVIPSFHGFGNALDFEAADCVGQPLAAAGDGSRRFRLLRSAGVSSNDFTVSPGDDGRQVLWLRSTAVSDASSAGPIALVRPRPSELDVYALGDYQGSARHSRFQTARIGSTTLVVGLDDACADVKVDMECQSNIIFYVASSGRLIPAAKTPAQRVRSGTLKEIGRVQYRLAADVPVFDARSVRVREKFSVRDSGSEEIRKAEGERVFVLHDDTLVASAPSLWEQEVSPP